MSGKLQRKIHLSSFFFSLQTNNSSALINLLPILLLIGLSMMSSFFISDPMYSLTPSQWVPKFMDPYTILLNGVLLFLSKYSVKRETNGLKIPYYVKDNFYSEYQGSVARLEESVEEDFVNHLKHSCSRERNYREYLERCLCICICISIFYYLFRHCTYRYVLIFIKYFLFFVGDSMLAKARTFGDRDLYRKAQNINTPSCENLQKYLITWFQ